jgi:hypothetical protein
LVSSDQFGLAGADQWFEKRLEEIPEYYERILWTAELPSYMPIFGWIVQSDFGAIVRIRAAFQSKSDTRLCMVVDQRGEAVGGASMFLVMERYETQGPAQMGPVRFAVPIASADTGGVASVLVPVTRDPKASAPQKDSPRFTYSIESSAFGFQTGRAFPWDSTGNWFPDLPWFEDQYLCDLKPTDPLRIQVVRKADAQPVSGATAAWGLPFYVLSNVDQRVTDKDGFFTLQRYDDNSAVRVSIGNSRTLHWVSEIRKAGNKIVIE